MSETAPVGAELPQPCLSRQEASRPLGLSAGPQSALSGRRETGMLPRSPLRSIFVECEWFAPPPGGRQDLGRFSRLPPTGSQAAHPYPGPH